MLSFASPMASACQPLNPNITFQQTFTFNAPLLIISPRMRSARIVSLSSTAFFSLINKISVGQFSDLPTQKLDLGQFYGRLTQLQAFFNCQKQKKCFVLHKHICSGSSCTLYNSIQKFVKFTNHQIIFCLGPSI